MTRTHIRELQELAAKARLEIQHDCGGYRLVRAASDNSNAYVFPDGGVCPTATKRECVIFLKGYIEGKRLYRREGMRWFVCGVSTSGVAWESALKHDTREGALTEMARREAMPEEGYGPMKIKTMTPLPL